VGQGGGARGTRDYFLGASLANLRHKDLSLSASGGTGLMIGVNLPSTTRWYTFSPHLACQGAGILFHRALPRILRRVLNAEPRAALDDDPESNFHASAHKKKTQALGFVGASGLMGVVSSVSCPLTTEAGDL